MRLTLHPEALRELIENGNWYDSTKDGLGDRFEFQVERVFQRLCEFPRSGVVYPFGTRRTLVMGFPYSIIYIPRKQRIIIVAIAGHKQRPYYWAHRV